jgi:6-phosphogluconolactonase
VKGVCILALPPVSVFTKPNPGIVVGVLKSSLVRVAICCSLPFIFCRGTLAGTTEWAFVASPLKGIYSYKVNAEKAEVLEAGRAAEFEHATFLAIHPNGKSLYAVAEGGTGRDSLVASFSIDRDTGRLELKNTVPSGGRGPCHITVNPTGEAAMVANYNSGSFAAFPIELDGRLRVLSSLVQDKGSSVDKKRQEGPHAHCIICGPKSHWALGCDLGLDRVMVFRLNASEATVVANNPPSIAIKPGAGPRHIALHPNNKFAYVINELNSTLTVLSWDKDTGRLRMLQNISTLPADFKGTNYPAEVAVHPNGKFVFGSNRGHDSVVIYAVDQKAGTVTLVGHQPCGGHWPRHLEIDTTGKLMFVSNEQSAGVATFRIDSDNGTLKPTEMTLGLERPMCVKCIEAK